MSTDVEGNRRLALLATEARELEKLTEHESWGILRARFEALRADDLTSLARQIMSDRVPSPEDLAERRGFWKGAEWVLNNPALAEKAYERANERTKRSG